jgi:hypothetical protein
MMKTLTSPTSRRRAWYSQLQLLLLLLWGIATVGALQVLQPAAAAGRPAGSCAGHARHRQTCHHPRPHLAHTQAGHWSIDANGYYWYVDPAGRRWYLNPAYGVLSYADTSGHQWLLDLSGHLYYLDPAGRVWYVDPAGRFWYADPYGRFWFYVDQSGHYGIVNPNAGGYPGSGYVAPSASTGTTDPRFSNDANGNWVTSLPADGGTIGVVDGCVSYIPSAGSGDDQTSYQGGNC